AGAPVGSLSARPEPERSLSPHVFWAGDSAATLERAGGVAPTGADGAADPLGRSTQAATAASTAAPPRTNLPSARRMPFRCTTPTNPRRGSSALPCCSELANRVELRREPVSNSLLELPHTLLAESETRPEPLQRHRLLAQPPRSNDEPL